MGWDLANQHLRTLGYAAPPLPAWPAATWRVNLERIRLCETAVSGIYETGFSGFLHSIGETETGFAKPSKPGPEMVSLTKPEIVHVFTLNYLSSSSLKLRLTVTYTYSTSSILKYFDRCRPL